MSDLSAADKFGDPNKRTSQQHYIGISWLGLALTVSRPQRVGIIAGWAFDECYDVQPGLETNQGKSTATETQ